jgi:PTS system mannose-specific IID component
MMSTWLRLFTLQASWTDERLQGIGAAFAVEPLLRELSDASDERYRAALARSAGYFNTHPFFAGLALGAIARAERDGVEMRRVERLRSALKGPLGSLGDRLIWAGVLPLASAVGLVLTALGHPVAGIVALLVIFNVAHLALWLWGLPTGWRLGTAVAQSLQNLALQRALALFGPMAACAVGFALPVVGVHLLTGLSPDVRLAAMALAGATVIVLRVVYPGFGAARLGTFAAAAALIMGWIWG